jgi:peroxiredoxin
MKSIRVLGILILLLTSLAFRPKKEVSLLGNEIKDFSLKNTDGKKVSLSNFKNAKGFIVVFTCNHCPFAKLYSKRFNDLNKTYSVKGVPFLAINSMDTLVYEEESFELMKQKATNDNFNFPYLYDCMQIVGKNFKAEHTPHAFVIWKENNKWIIKYSGAIDDNGEHPEKATHYVANAVDDLLHENPVKMPETQSFGCAIFYRK